MDNNAAIKAFIVGFALGDGNLSNPNGRAVRLRITCDVRYTDCTLEIKRALELIFPTNRVSEVARKDNCVDISLYSNKLIELIPWKAGCGTKYDQQARVPKWIFETKRTVRACLRGLIITDGSIYTDRGYQMVNISTNIKPLANDAIKLAAGLGYSGTMSTTRPPSGRPKYTVRFAKDATSLLTELGLSNKS